MSHFRALTVEEIRVMEVAGCRAEVWSGIGVKDGFDPARVRNVTFRGRVTIGALNQDVSLPDGLTLPAEILDATIINCVLGDNVRIARIGSHLMNYEIGAGAVVTDVGVMVTHPGAAFGNGVELQAVNEGGGREVRIFNQMSSQFAYLVAMHRYRADLIKRMQAMVDDCVSRATSDLGKVGQRAFVAHVSEIEDVNVGPFAIVSGASRLKNGTLLSEEQAPASIGAAVVAEDFILCEGSTVDSGASLSRCFVGQGVKMGRHFSAENSLFFANSECFQGEACSTFSGPYTVTHHKSTLLIAALTSFFNAGSGTNQSNHMYKLGPVHQGIIERGTKMGSFSYMLWPSVVGPFSVVIGKHLANIDTGDFPFSYVTEQGAESFLTPAMNLFSSGTARDSQKWPRRDRRKARLKRDLIRFEVFSPYVSQKMVRAEATLKQLYEHTPKEVENVRHKGVLIKRLLLRRGARSYSTAIDLYINGRILERVAHLLDRGDRQVKAALAPVEGSIHSQEWADVSGLLIARARLAGLEKDIECGRIATVEDFHVAFAAACEAYPGDEWAWVRRTFESRTGKSVDALGLDDLREIRAAHKKAIDTSKTMILADARKEFEDAAKIGYGADGDEEEKAVDFEAVRGHFEDDALVKELRSETTGVE